MNVIIANAFITGWTRKKDALTNQINKPKYIYTTDNSISIHCRQSSLPFPFCPCQFICHLQTYNVFFFFFKQTQRESVTCVVIWFFRNFRFYYLIATFIRYTCLYMCTNYTSQQCESKKKLFFSTYCSNLSRNCLTIHSFLEWQNPCHTKFVWCHGIGIFFYGNA